MILDSIEFISVVSLFILNKIKQFLFIILQIRPCFKIILIFYVIKITELSLFIPNVLFKFFNCRSDTTKHLPQHVFDLLFTSKYQIFVESVRVDLNHVLVHYSRLTAQLVDDSPFFVYLVLDDADLITVLANVIVFVGVQLCFDVIVQLVDDRLQLVET